MVSPYISISFSVFFTFYVLKNGSTATTLCNKVRVRDNSKSKSFLLTREIEKFGTFRNTYTKRWPTWGWVVFYFTNCLSRMRWKLHVRFWGGERLRGPTYPNRKSQVQILLLWLFKYYINKNSRRKTKKYKVYKSIEIVFLYLSYIPKKD